MKGGKDVKQKNKQNNKYVRFFFYIFKNRHIK